MDRQERIASQLVFPLYPWGGKDPPKFRSLKMENLHKTHGKPTRFGAPGAGKHTPSNAVLALKSNQE